jgi:peptidoglycan/LPS O-acetylase OafA/YrhL
MDTLGAGALLAMMSVRRRHWPVSIAAVGGAFGLFAIGCSIASHDGFERSFAIAAFVTLGGPWIVQRAAAGFGGSVGRVLSSGPVVAIGAVSYGIYIWHGPIRAMATRWNLATAPASAFLVTAAASISLAFVSWMLYERPINSLKRFFPYTRSDTHTAAEPSDQPFAVDACVPAFAAKPDANA